MDQSLTKVMRSIGVALKLDDNNNSQSAYIQYLECVLSIVSNLLQYVRADGGKVIVSQSVHKQVQLGKQCMERLSSLVEEFTTTTSTCSSSQPAASLSPGTTDDINNDEKQIGRFSAPVPPLPGNESKAEYSLTRTLTPTELAYCKNQSIMKAYKARLEKMSSKNPQAASLNLTVQRKLAENLAIANAQEKALSEKMRETQRRLDDQAARRFASPVGMSEDEQEQRKIYKKILEYEQQAKWLAEWRKKLSNSPEDPVVISQVISVILRCKDHPLTQLLKKYQYKIYERLYPLVSTKMALVNDASVPLPEKFHPNTASGDPPTEKATEETGTSDTAENIDSKEMQNDNKNIDSKETQDDNKNIDNKVTQDDNKTAVNDTEESNNNGDMGNVDKCDLVSVTESVKSNIEKAVDENEKLCQDLQQDNEMSKSMYRSLSNVCENYIDEDMDDLFDDDDEHDEQRPDCDKGEVLNKPCNSESYVVLSTKDVDQPSNTRDNLFNFRKKSTGLEQIETLADEAYSRHLKVISQDVHTAFEKLLFMFAIAYEEFSSPEGQDQCYASIEEPFFKPIWKYLLTLFRLSNRKQELLLAYHMTFNTNTRPEDHGVSKKLCLTSEVDEMLPFQSGIDELTGLSHHYTMLSKLECVVTVCRLICECVENFYATKQIEDGEICSTPSVGADDLLPILSYVVVKSGLPQLVSECQAMAEFIHEGYIMGEEGYCLTSLQTAINFICLSEKNK